MSWLDSCHGGAVSQQNNIKNNDDHIKNKDDNNDGDNNDSQSKHSQSCPAAPTAVSGGGKFCLCAGEQQLRTRCSTPVNPLSRTDLPSDWPSRTPASFMRDESLHLALLFLVLCFAMLNGGTRLQGELRFFFFFFTFFLHNYATNFYMPFFFAVNTQQQIGFVFWHQR